MHATCDVTQLSFLEPGAGACSSAGSKKRPAAPPVAPSRSGGGGGAAAATDGGTGGRRVKIRWTVEEEKTLMVSECVSERSRLYVGLKATTHS